MLIRLERRVTVIDPVFSNSLTVRLPPMVIEPARCLYRRSR